MEHERDLPDVLTWHVMPDGLHVWEGGYHVGVIPRGSFARLIEKLAREL